MDALWHWVFSLFVGFLAGWSWAGYRTAEEKRRRGHLLRGVVSLAAIGGLSYNGWNVNSWQGVLTLGVCLAGLIAGYTLGSRWSFQRAHSPVEEPTDEHCIDPSQ